MRPFRPGCGTVSKAQLLTLPEIIRIIAPGVVTTQLSSLPPASSSATDVLGSSESRLATAQPPEPPPTTTKSNVSVTRAPPGFYLAGRIGRAVGSKAGLLCKFWQEGPIASVFVTNFPILAVIKSSKVGFQPFPKQMRVGTYPSRPQGHLPRAFAKGICQGHLLRVAFSGSLRTGSIGALCAVAKSVSAIGF